MAESLDEYQRISGELRSAIADGNLDIFQTTLLAWFKLREHLKAPDPFPNPILEICAHPFTPDSFALLPPPIKLYALNTIFREGILRLHDLSPQLEFLERDAALANVATRFHPPFIYLQLVGLLLQGEIARATDIFRRQEKKLTGFGLRGWLLFTAGADQEALRSFKTDLATLRRREKSPAAYFTGLEGLLLPIVLLASHPHHHLGLLKKILADLEMEQPHNPLLPVYRIFNGVIAMLENRPDTARRLLSQPPPADHAVALIFNALAHHWLGGGIPRHLSGPLHDLEQQARLNSHLWLAANAAELLSSPLAKGARLPGNNRSLAEVIRSREPWQHALLALEQAPPQPDRLDPEPDRRLAWHLEYLDAQRNCRLKPVIQHRRPGGEWSKGRPLALRRLVGGADIGSDNQPVLLDRRDQALRNSIRREIGPGGETFRLIPELEPLVGHPHLFLADQPQLRVKVEAGRPALLLEKEPDGTMLARLLPFPDHRHPILVRQGPGDFQAIFPDRELLELADRLGPSGLRIPADRGIPDLFDKLGKLPADLTLFSSLEQLPLKAVPVTADPRVMVQLLPSGQGLRLRLRVRPLGADGPSLPPGEGAARIWAESRGVRRRVQRDLAAERTSAARVIKLCDLPLTTRLADSPDGEPASWLLNEPHCCLEFLDRLRQHFPATILEWPEGETLSLSPTVGLNRLHLKLGKKNNWFGLEGDLRLDNGLVLELSKLLRAAAAGPGRFIPLGHGRFLSLSAELRRRLDEIEAYAEIRRGEVRMHPLAARIILDPDNQQSSQPALETDQPWQDFLAKLTRTDAQPAPLPAGLNTELRPYQLQGYQWLQRLAELGFGACLADDMGLGKTVQVLALLLDRAARGPSLVIAPTSVCRNWEDEVKRFTPSLKVLPYDGPRRRRLLTKLAPGDLLICSYSLLQRDVEAISSTHWGTIVLDEAQAIKNFLAKRSRAAMKLTGEFKLITTGTPLENHLAELWTLFRFINPGLLGSLDHFNKRFILPIEQHHDAAARKRLKKLLTPFILRRLKSEVLSELPPRTDVTLRVEMGHEESALYEALRRRALLNLESGRERRESPLRILAEIMKLRRACCHPRLVLPDSTLPCAKLDLFAKVVAELLENRHKILVFSQFVDHLTIVRELLEREKISYQYLDGSTPAATRQRRVRAFQQGRGDIFLISLRAGGLGLNLTAADYVIHLDPWWNPAVEEQASDRAHRIGQTKPVTVYRLITSGTIEEKILALHRQKRRLSTELLDGNRPGPPQSSAELLALLQNR